ncbi:MAG: biotin/lipoyl-binding protein [Planctomycetes bacterium]|nr:biotin/lipoyl-binding protein [Planctomycetota bacterium]
MKFRTKALLVSLLGAAASFAAWQATRPKPPTKVLTARVESVPVLRSLVTGTGEIRAKEFVNIQAEVSGLITELLVREGDVVEAGQVLLKLDDRQLRAEVDAARAQVAAADAEAKNAEVGVATAVANVRAEETALANLRLEVEQAAISRDRAAASLQRKQQLFAQNLIGSEEFEVADAEARLALRRAEASAARCTQGEANLHAMQTRVSAAEAMREGAKARRDAAQATLARTTDMLGKTVLRAPLSGRVTKLNVEKGERAVPGIQSNPIATLMTIADMSVVEAEIRVAEAEIVRVQGGAEAVVEVDALRDQKLVGVVSEVGQSPIQASGTATQSQEGKEFRVLVRLTAPPAALRPGLTATAEIVTAVRSNCLVVPMQALTAREVKVDPDKRYLAPPEPRGDELPPVLTATERLQLEELEGVFVMVDGRARFRPIRYGIQGDMDVELLEGLAEGEQVVIGPVAALRTLKEWDHVVLDEKRQTDDALRLRRKRK